MNEGFSFSNITREILDRDKDTDIMYRIVETLRSAYRRRLERIILFESHRDERNGTWTGVEIVIFLTHMKDRWEESRKIHSLVMDISLEFGICVCIIPFDSSLAGIRLMPPFLEEVLHRGVDL